MLFLRSIASKPQGGKNVIVKVQIVQNFEPKTLAEPRNPPRKRRKKPTANHPNFDLHSSLYRITGIDLTLIDGLDALTRQTILDARVKLERLYSTPSLS